MSSHGNSRRCMAIKPDGDPCRAWAIRGSDPPRCAAHSGKVGAPSGNQNALNRVLGLVPRPNLPAETGTSRGMGGKGRECAWWTTDTNLTSPLFGYEWANGAAAYMDLCD